MSQDIIKLLILIFLCISGGLKGNALLNPGFEAGVYWTYQFSPWALSPGNEPGWLWDFSAKKNGRWAIFIPFDDTLKQRIGVTPFTDYIITVPIATTGGASWMSNIIYLYVDGQEVFSVLTELDDNLRYYSAAFNTGNRDTVTIGFRVWTETAGRVRVDDIMLAMADTVRPRILSATAYDGEVQLPGKDDDDYIVIAFSEPTNTPRIWIDNIDEVFSILSGHTWLSSEGRLWSTTWNSKGDTLRIDLYAVTGQPSTIEVGDQFHADLYTITDECGNPVYRGLIPITITGSFYGGPMGPLIATKEPFQQQNDMDKFSDKAIVTEHYIYESQ